MRWFLALLTWVLLALSANAGQTWIVAADGSGDFLVVQQAIDAASPGDLILVKPGSYPAFTVNKALTVVGSGENETICGTIAAVGVPSGHVVIASMRALDENPFTADLSPNATLSVWKVSLEVPAYLQWPVGSALAEFKGAFLNNVIQLYDPAAQTGNAMDPPEALQIVFSRNNFISQCSFHAWDLYEWGSWPGGSGILLWYDARAYIAETDSIGGRGAKGYLSDECYVSHKGGRGGAGILLERSDLPEYGPCEAYIFGRPSNVILGGPGGIGDKVISYCDIGEGGDGGIGIQVNPGGGYASYSGVVPQGGPGGEGHPPGSPGPPIWGNIDRIVPPLPTSTMEGDGKPGTTVTFSFHGTSGDQVSLVYSTLPDVLWLRAFEGHPLIASPAGVFGVVPIGTIDDSGTKSVSFTVPTDAAPGVALYVQGVHMGAHPPQITNMSMVVTTPVWQ
ncbi:MAG: hypothetical protein AB1486_33035 [Planctomycetota bacterium]